MRTAVIASPTSLALGAGAAEPAQAAPLRFPTSTYNDAIAPTSSDSAPSVSSAVYYELENDSFEISRPVAQSLGYRESEIHRFEGNLSALTPAESRQLAEVLGLNIQASKEQRAVPAVIWVIAAAIGGAAADEIIGQVTNWGIGSACRNLNGRWGTFDDFCRSNGHV
ncbi:hypothetical protein [Corynebacterium liangguodongii]|uniref:hypothetical protein n=1 Tax=Corynebacterium liangguodongii TaxID=2079535 RepID=UPI0011B227D8|nr:hypothetical protein [Corynebacterium liangguodongii]